MGHETTNPYEFNVATLMANPNWSELATPSGLEAVVSNGLAVDNAGSQVCAAQEPNIRHACLFAVSAPRAVADERADGAES
jgi:hypothetical protein